MFNKFNIILCYLLLTIHSFAHSSCTEEILQKAKDDKDFEMIKLCALEGIPDAMNYLGLYYDKGFGGAPQDYEKALYWYHKAIEKGNTSAMFGISDLYKDGNGVEQDYSKSLEWLYKAADAGASFAFIQLGRAYKEGKIVTRDYNIAFKFFKISSDQGNTYATHEIGIFYLLGLGVTQDYNLAKKYLKKASEHPIFQESYNQFLKLPEFLGLKLSKSTISDLKTIYPNIEKFLPATYGIYDFQVFAIDPSQIKSYNVKKNGLLFNTDGKLEYMEFVFPNDQKLHVFFKLKKLFDKKYGKAFVELITTPYKLISYKVGYNFVEVHAKPETYYTTLIIQTEFFRSLAQK
jgi:Sel1 repeat